MPTYEYECLACKHRFERVQKFSEPPVSECPECGSAVRKVLFPAGIVFKGSGWYVTDSRPSSTSENGASGASGATTSTGAEGGAGEKKSEPATASKTEAKTEASGSPGSAKKSDSPKTSTTSSSTASKA